jgi:hypothetical protein
MMLARRGPGALQGMCGSTNAAQSNFHEAGLRVQFLGCG